MNLPFKRIREILANSLDLVEKNLEHKVKFVRYSNLECPENSDLKNCVMLGINYHCTSAHSDEIIAEWLECAHIALQGRFEEHGYEMILDISRNDDDFLTSIEIGFEKQGE